MTLVAAAALAVSAGAAWTMQPAAAAMPLEVLTIALQQHHASPPAVMAGLRFGADEIAHTARLLRKEVRVVIDARGEHVRIAVTPDTIAIHAPAPGSGVASSGCVFHVRPTAAARDAALRHWRASAEPAPHARVVEWHPSLTRYGAAQLNERFARATRQQMDADAWAGWLAVKAAGEALLRAADDVCLTLGRHAIDGHKGVPLGFDASTGHLRQPLYIATAETVLAQVTAP